MRDAMKWFVWSVGASYLATILIMYILYGTK